MDLMRHVFNHQRIGIVYAFGSTLCFTFSDLFAQFIMITTKKNIPKLQIVLIRNLIQILFLIPFLLVFGAEFIIPRTKWPSLIIIGALQFIGTIGLYYALSFVPLADFFLLSATCPMITPVLSFFILNERWTVIDTLCGSLNFVGVILVMRPASLFGAEGIKGVTLLTSGKNRYQLFLIGCIISLIYGINRALYFILSRKWYKENQTENGAQLVLLFYESVFVFIMAQVAMIFHGDVFVYPESWEVGFPLLSVGVCTTLASMCIVYAAKTERATMIGVIRNFNVIEAFIVQYIFMHIEPGVWSLSGSFVITGSAIVTSFRDRLVEKYDSLND